MFVLFSFDQDIDKSHFPLSYFLHLQYENTNGDLLSIKLILRIDDCMVWGYYRYSDNKKKEESMSSIANFVSNKRKESENYYLLLAIYILKYQS